MNTVGIVGNGFVGKGMVRFFGERFDVSVYDPAQMRLDETAITAAGLVVICVPTPEDIDGSANIDMVRDAVERFHKARLIVIKSTVPPGTTQSLIDKYGDHIHFSPEYMGEGMNYVDSSRFLDPRDARSHPFVIVGGYRCSEVLAYFQRIMSTSARYISCRPVEAELAKYMENTYLAMKVSFCNEWLDIAEAHGADYNVIRELWLNDPRVNPSHTLVFRDQRGFTGKCLPKDVAAIKKSSLDHGIETPVLEAIATRKIVK